MYPGYLTIGLFIKAAYLINVSSISAAFEPEALPQTTAESMAAMIPFELSTLAIFAILVMVLLFDMHPNQCPLLRIMRHASG